MKNVCVCVCAFLIVTKHGQLLEFVVIKFFLLRSSPSKHPKHSQTDKWELVRPYWLNTRSRRLLGSYWGSALWLGSLDRINNDLGFNVRTGSRSLCKEQFLKRCSQRKQGIKRVRGGVPARDALND